MVANIPEPVDTRICGVRGELLRWARTEQSLTMRWIRERGGPSPGYQCEVERGHKTEVRAELLTAWVKALGVTEIFARGRVPRIHHELEACLGMAAPVGHAVRQGEPAIWRAMRPEQRTAEVLRLVSRLPGLPPVVLAHVLGLGLSTLEAILDGMHPVLHVHVRAAAHITTLPEHFFTYGAFDRAGEGGMLPMLLSLPMPPEEMAAWREALSNAIGAGVTPAELHDLAEKHRRGA